jgi:hypothetical protein
MATNATQINPDTSSGFNGGLIGGLVVSGIVFVLFIQYATDTGFKFILWAITLLSVFFISIAILAYYQFMTCNTILISPLLYGTIVPVATSIFGLSVSSFITCRRPIASAFAPLILSDDDIAKVSPQKSASGCCTPSLDLVKIEKLEPLIMGISYSFYMIFAMLFGIIGGRGYAIVC